MTSIGDDFKTVGKTMLFRIKWLPYVIIILSLLVAIPLFLFKFGDKRIPLATITSLNLVEQNWYSRPGINSYNMTVDLSFHNEKRQHSVTVINGDIHEATIKYWDFEKRDWGKTIPASVDTGYWFTIPGLFHTIRTELQNGIRKEIRVSFSEENNIPETIILGVVNLQGETQTESMVKFQILEYKEFLP